MELWKGAPVAAAIKEEAIQKIEELKKIGVVPTLAVVRIGEEEDDLAYERGILKRFESCGARVRVVELPVSVTQLELEEAVKRLNEDSGVHGILIFSSFPKGIDKTALRRVISPQKDVDGFGWENLGYIFAQDDRAFPPCTAKAVMEMLSYYNVDLTGKRATVIGRSLVVGRPAAMMLMNENATVTICHTKTADTPAEARRADILVVTAGVKKLVGKEYLREGQIVLDVGIHEDGDSLCGDVKADEADMVAALTPVPGGVGSVTTAVLLKHTVISAERMSK